MVIHTTEQMKDRSFLQHWNIVNLLVGGVDVVAPPTLQCVGPTPSGELIVQQWPDGQLSVMETPHR